MDKNREGFKHLKIVFSAVSNAELKEDNGVDER